MRCAAKKRRYSTATPTLNATTISNEMPYRPEAELKRPDLKGEFLCGHCGKTFCHAASLNRHRLNFHGDDQQCLLCMKQISANDTVRRHMQMHHSIPRVFTCGCCNWTFPDKKELHSHNNSMMKTGQPGEASAIAISSRPPGSLSQHELRGEERTPKQKKRSSKADSLSPSSASKTKKTVADIFSSAANLSNSLPNTPIPANWLSALIMSTPTLLPFLQQQQFQQQLAALNVQPSTSNASTDDESAVEVTPSSSSMSNSERASTSLSTVSSIFQNNNYSLTHDEETMSNGETKTEPMDHDEDVDQNFPSKEFALTVKTEHLESSACSGPESGIGSSGDDGCSLSPCSVIIRSKEGSPGSVEEQPKISPSSTSNPLNVANLLASPANRKRKSVDAIASLLFKKKCLMG